MRAVHVLMLATACGRIGIDPLDDAALQTKLADAAPVACETDGTPCEDGNICSVTSVCANRICVATGDAPTTCTVARSDTDFATVQGGRGWYYGFYNTTADTDLVYDPATDFETAALFSGDLWRPPAWEPEPSPSFTWSYLAAWGGHPGSYPARRASIRRWLSSVTGAATAVIHAAKADTNGGDGVKILLVVDGLTRFSRTLQGTDGTGFTEAIALDLVPGTRVDLFLDPNGTDAVDTTTLTLQITSR